MDEYLLSAPLGFTSAVNTINKCDHASAVLADLVLRTLSFVDAADSEEATLPPQTFCQKLNASGVELSLQSVESVIHATVYILRGALRLLSSSPGDLQAALQHSTDLSDTTAEVFALGFAHYLKLKTKKQAKQKAAAQAEDGSASALAGVTARAPASSGRVVGMDWKVGVRVASDRCEELNTAFVTVVLRIANADGEVTANAVEMSVPEFNSFASTLREIGRKLDSV